MAAKKPAKKKSAKAKSDVFPRIQEIIAKQLKKPAGAVTPKSKLQTDLGADSLDAMEIIFQLEEEFNIKISEEEARSIVSINDIVRCISKKPKV